MNKNITFYFTYNNNDEYKHNLDILTEVFGHEILQTLKENIDGIVSVQIQKCNEIQLFELLQEFDNDELRILLIADDLIIGTDRHLNIIGY